MDGTEILKTFAKMHTIGVKAITIEQEDYDKIKGELLRWLTHNTNGAGDTVICGITIKINKA